MGVSWPGDMQILRVSWRTLPLSHNETTDRHSFYHRLVRFLRLRLRNVGSLALYEVLIQMPLGGYRHTVLYLSIVISVWRLCSFLWRLVHL
ncbi:hypothetical protein BDV32DRAFT_127061 [Aspergillus pseudonomiae]|nr:hypothetical protein BDV32DRAFT_127061 [Aspergillus pseudonomiae]